MHIEALAQFLRAVTHGQHHGFVRVKGNQPLLGLGNTQRLLHLHLVVWCATQDTNDQHLTTGGCCPARAPHTMPYLQLQHSGGLVARHSQRGASIMLDAVCQGVEWFHAQLHGVGVVWLPLLQRYKVSASLAPSPNSHPPSHLIRRGPRFKAHCCSVLEAQVMQRLLFVAIVRVRGAAAARHVAAQAHQLQWWRRALCVEQSIPGT